MHKIINDTKAPKAVGTYSQGAYAEGFYYFSGQIGLSPQSMEMAPTFDQQLSQIMDNIDALLVGSNLNRENIIKTTVFLTDLANFSKVNAAYETFFKAPFPARSTIEVKGLPKGALVEIEVIAYKK
jgi:2-iminobutanoate/2-iminopropanoate deaminase